jgi:hypothetical protein
MSVYGAKWKGQMNFADREAVLAWCSKTHRNERQVPVRSPRQKFARTPQYRCNLPFNRLSG